MTSYCHNATCVLPLVYSGSQPGDDLMGYVLFYKFVFDGYLFIPYCIVQHNGMHNFKGNIQNMYGPGSGCHT